MVDLSANRGLESYHSCASEDSLRVAAFDALRKVSSEVITHLEFEIVFDGIYLQGADLRIQHLLQILEEGKFARLRQILLLLTPPQPEEVMDGIHRMFPQRRFRDAVVVRNKPQMKRVPF